MRGSRVTPNSADFAASSIRGVFATSERFEGGRRTEADPKRCQPSGLPARNAAWDQAVLPRAPPPRLDAGGRRLCERYPGGAFPNRVGDPDTARPPGRRRHYHHRRIAYFRNSMADAENAKLSRLQAEHHRESGKL